MATAEVEEVRRLDRLIHQFEVVYRSTDDDDQRGRVRKELKKLKEYRDQYLALHDVNGSELKESTEVADELEGFPILRDLLRDLPYQPENPDEIYHLRLYMECFYDEFMIFLTPKKLRLDSKFSLERDRFYAEYHELLRQVQDFTKTVESSADLMEKIEFRSDLTADLRNRTQKMRTNLMIKAARYFLRIRTFASEILDDLQQEGGACKNSEEVLEFQELKGIRYLGGLTVWHALQLLLALGREVVEYLDVPDAALQ